MQHLIWLGKPRYAPGYPQTDLVVSDDEAVDLLATGLWALPQEAPTDEPVQPVDETPDAEPDTKPAPRPRRRR